MDKEKMLNDTVNYIQKLEQQKRMVQDTISSKAEELKKNQKEYVKDRISEEEMEHQRTMKKLQDIAKQSDAEKIARLKEFLKKDSIQP